MRIHIATDHAGLEFSTELQRHLTSAGHEVVDHGPIAYEPLDDYPAFCIRAAQAVVRDQAAGIETLGVVFGGSGNGEQIAANKVLGVRAALVWNLSTAELARQHNDANVIAIGARQHTFAEASEFIDRFIATPFSNEERHSRRIAQLAAYETDGSLVADPRAGHTSVSAPDSFDPEAG
ncbi:ribose 5-phosphate isomerase B [Microbacterium endophyticum]|uniref:Ribose-5-phosphate isomerase B n=1 Tax=Microbacterium endophyticum TaxID=1526412 RepID=A0A7W4V110_9MICO|nr:ribose-5-phosphate isomerase [Microbacterium endophyticum]MBB2974569.1 ribose 5-phosphate isomerase B [Microbacterium endophyticum]NIK36866.1 ribose 5-phosphate isomerase B [Microbacterium endophyticum]